jgi:hypothetical protein
MFGAKLKSTEHSRENTIRPSIDGSVREAVVLGEFLVHHTA